MLSRCRSWASAWCCPKCKFRNQQASKRLAPMTTQLSPRAQFGLIVPSTNTVVETEFNWMRVEGVSWHAGRIYIPNPVLDDDASFVAFLENLRTEIGRTVRDVITAKV